jgi:outer membrane protein assembly factor BamB/beta-lactamase regulating signal transducer with metallopeptidase domain/thiol-disulfide isomerase/thioredoxin
MTALDLWGSSIPLHITKALLDLMALGVAVGAAAYLANRLLRTASASRRYLLNLALLGILCVSLPIVLTLHLASGSRSETRRAAEPSRSLAESAVGIPELTDRPPAISVPLNNVPPRLPQVGPLPHPALDEPTRAAGISVSLKDIAPVCIAGAYCLGVLVMVIRLLAALYGGHRLRRAARSICEPRILELVKRQSRAIGLRIIPAVACCERVAVPVVVGILRPVILVPVSLVSTLTPAELCDVLTHELAHLRRFDHLVVVLQRATEVLWFFHPTVWYLSRQISLEREYCCDDLALTAGVERRSYAKSLCRVAELAIASRCAEPRPLALAADGQRPSQLRRRIIRLLSPRPEPTVHLTRAGLIGLAALLAGAALAPLLAPALNIRSQSLLAAAEDPPTNPEPAQLLPAKGLSAPDYTQVTGYVANAALPTSQPVVLWKFTSEVGFRSVVTADGVVYLGTDDGQMIALSATDGSVVWKYAIPGRAEAVKKTESDTRKWDLTHNGPRYVLTDYFRVGKPALDKEYVYFGTPTGVTAIRRDTGKFVWHRNIEHGVLESTPLPIGQRVYVSGYDGKAYSLHRPTGHVVWEHNLVEDAPPDPPGFPGTRARFDPSPARPAGAACDGKIFVQCVFDQSRVVAIDCVTGNKRWSFRMGGFTAAAPTIVNDRVYIGSQDQTLSCLSLQSGKVLWKFGAPTWLNSRVAVHAGKVYLTCNHGELFQLDAENGQTIRHFVSNEDQKSYSCSPIVDDHAVYFATSNGHFFALGVDGLQTAWQLRPAPDSESVTDPATDGRRIFVTAHPKLSDAGEHAVIALGDPALAVKQPAARSGRQPASPRAEADEVSKHLAMIKATETRPRGFASGVSKTFSAVVMASDGTKSILLSAYWGAAPFPIGKTGLPLGPVFLRDTEEPVKVLACDERRGIGVFSVDKPLDPIPENLITEQLRPGDSLDPLQTSEDGPGKAYRVVAVEQICRHETASGQIVGVEHAIRLDRSPGRHRNPGSWLLKDGKLAAICLDNFRDPASKRLEGYALPIKFARQAFAQWISANNSQHSSLAQAGRARPAKQQTADPTAAQGATSKTPEPSREGKCYVTGIVFDKETKRPVVGAQIHVLAAAETDPAKRSLSGTTQADGRYRIEVPMGTSQIWFPTLKPGYWLEDKEAHYGFVTTPEKPIATHDIAARRGPVWPIAIAVNDGPLDLTEAYLAVWEIKDDKLRQATLRGEPVSFYDPLNQAFSALGPNGAGLLTQSGESGKLVVNLNDPQSRIESLRAELVVDPKFDMSKIKSVTSVTATDKTRMIDERGAQATVSKATVSLRGGLPLLIFRVTRAKPLPSQELSGRVVDRAGHPLAGVRVGASLGTFGGGGADTTKSTQSDNDGRFVLKVPIPETSNRLYASLILNKDGYAGQDSPRLALATPPARIDAGTLTLHPGFSLPVRVVDGDDHPLAGATIEPMPAYALRRLIIRTDTGGRGVLRDLPSGILQISVNYGQQWQSQQLVISGVAADNAETTIRLKSTVAVRPRDTPKLVPLAVGKTAPDWEVAEWSDRAERRLSDYRGKVVVLDFWGTWCAGCVSAIPTMQALADKYEPQGVVFLSIHTPAGSMEQINKLRKLKSWNAPVALDRGASLSEGQTAQRYGVSGFPTVIIIDRDGKIGFNTSVEPKDRAAFLRSMQAVAKSAKIAFPSDKNGSDAEAEKQMNALVNALLSAEIDASLARRAR